MTLIRTKMQPALLVDVDGAELESLTRQGLIYTPGIDLAVEWFTWPQEPGYTISPPSITITDISGTVVLATTTEGVRQTILGWAYHWPATAQPVPGIYTAHWSESDGTRTGTADVAFTVPAPAGSGYGIGYGIGYGLSSSGTP